MKVVIFGAGYVGLVAGACFAKIGHHVTLVENDPDKIERLKRGESIIYEPGLEEYLREGNKTGCLSYTSDAAAACRDAQAIGIAVGTPPRRDGSCDLSYVWNVSETIGRNLSPGCVVFTKSTVPIGTGHEIVRIIRSLTGHDFSYASNPEFLKEGAAINDFMMPERVVIGVSDRRAEEIMVELYSPFFKRNARILITDIISAEIAKYACNSMLATRISFMNELARLCDAVQGDIETIRQIMGSDSRIGKSFLYPSIGYGGSCFPKDVQAVLGTARSLGLEMKVVQAAHDVNETQAKYFFQKIRDHYQGKLADRRFAVWGLAFKANTDDVRESQAIRLIRLLLASGVQVAVFDPEAMGSARRELHSSVEYGKTLYDILEQRDALIVATEWLQFRNPDFDLLGSVMREKTLFDGRNLFNPKTVAEKGFHYVSIGRQDGVPEVR